MPTILEVENYGVSFYQYKSFFTKGYVHPVESLSLRVKTGGITAIVGASGSGKSLLAHGVMGILPDNARESGKIVYQNTRLDRKAIRRLPPGEIALIPQSINYLDPLMTVGEQIRRLVRAGKPRIVQEDIFRRYDLDLKAGGLYPFQISGGMARRVLIASAVVQKPTLIIADEPTPGLDEDLVRETLRQLWKLKEDGCSILMITHDLQAARAISDEIVVFKDGRSLCSIPRSIFASPEAIRERSAYAAELFRALPENNFAKLPLRGTPCQNHVLQARGVSFAYKMGGDILCDVDFRVCSGEIVGVRGNSGRGKSTLGKLLAGYLKPVKGQITLDGKPLSSTGFRPVQLIYQHPEKALNPRWRMIKSLNEAGSADSKTLERLGISDNWQRRFPHEISGGEQQRFCIARIMNPAVKFLIADEMTAMFDAVTQADIWAAIVEYAREQSVGMVVISHDPHLLNRVCDRTVIL